MGGTLILGILVINLSIMIEEAVHWYNTAHIVLKLGVKEFFFFFFNLPK